MLRNYLVIAFRNIARNKIASIVNVLCLSVSVGCSLIAYLFVDSNFDSERFHVNGKNIFLVQHKAIDNGDLVTFGGTPIPLGPAIEAEHASVVRSVRVNYGIGTVKFNDQQFQELLTFADSAFFEMFTFPLEKGNTHALHSRENIILSQQAARKYFGNDNPVGKPMTITFGDLSGTFKTERTFIVAGVAQKFLGPSSCVDFSLLIPYENSLYSSQISSNDWSQSTLATFIQVTNPEDIKELSAQMAPYVNLQVQADKSNKPVKEFVFENLHDIRTNAANVRNSISGPMAWAPIIMLSVISIFLLSLACFNFMNVSLALIGNRLKEIGIRKVIGSQRSQLIAQFVLENVLICIAAFILAIVLTGSLLLPGFESIAGPGISLDLVGRIDLWLYLLTLLICVAVVSGLYPALFISSLKPIAILRDKFKLGTRGRFGSTLLTAQFVIALVTMMVSIGLTFNHLGMVNRDWGYSKENLLVIPVSGQEEFNLVKRLAMEQSSIKEVSGAKQHIGYYAAPITMSIGENKTDDVTFLEVATNYLSTMGVRLAWGKLPQTSQAVVVNEKFAQKFRIEFGKDNTVVIDTVTYTITGVVKNFHHEDFMQAIKPMVITIGNESEFSTVIARALPGKATQARTSLENAWKKMYPDKPFLSTFQDQLFDQMYRVTDGIVQIFLFTTAVALLMSCVGLYGIAAQHVKSRMRELCIRKIFGVPVVRAVFVVNSRFLVLLLVAAFIATPLSHFVLSNLLDSIYAYRMDISPTGFLFSYVLMFVTLAMTLSGKIYEIVKANPTKILRNE